MENQDQRLMENSALQNMLHPFEGPPEIQIDLPASLHSQAPAPRNPEPSGQPGADASTRRSSARGYHYLDVDALPTELDLKYGEHLVFYKYTDYHFDTIHNLFDSGYVFCGACASTPLEFEEVAVPSAGRLPGQPEHIYIVSIYRVILLGVGDLEVRLCGSHTAKGAPQPVKKIAYTIAS